MMCPFNSIFYALLCTHEQIHAITRTILYAALNERQTLTRLKSETSMQVPYKLCYRDARKAKRIYGLAAPRQHICSIHCDDSPQANTAVL